MIRSGLLASIVGLATSRLFDRIDSHFSYIATRIKIDLLRIVTGLVFIILGLITFAIFIQFGAVLLFLALAGIDMYTDAAMITTTIILLISLVFFYSGYRNIRS